MNPLDMLNAPHSSDFALSWIQNLFPAGDTPFGAAFATITTALVFFGTMVLGWQIVYGIAQSAYSGKVFADRWHSLFGPLRAVIGFGMLIPIAGGFSSAHYMLKEIVAPLAINIGNAPIRTYISEVAKNGKPVASPTTIGRDVFWIVMERELCLAVSNAATEEGGYGSITPPPANGTFIDAGWWNDASYNWDYGVCGSMSYSHSAETPENAEFSKTRAEATGDLIRSLRSISGGDGFTDRFAKAIAGSSGDFEDKQTVEAVTKAAGIVQGQILSWFNNQALQWNTKVTAAAAKVTAKQDELVKERLVDYIDQHGFVASGLYWRALSEMSAQTVAMVTEKPETKALQLYDSADERTQNAFRWIKTVFQIEGAKISANDLAMAGDSDSFLSEAFAPINQVRRYVAEQLTEAATAGGGSVDPVNIMMNFGHALLSAVTAVIAGMVVLAVATGNWFADKAGGSVVFGWLSQWVTYATLVLLVVGILHAYILPIVPFVMVFMMALSWVILFAEAMIAVVLWAFAFVRMDGQEFFDRQQSPGIALLFNLIMRPGLSILAFILAIHILPPTMNTLMSLWSQAFYGAQGGHSIDIWGFIAGLVIYTWLQWQISLRLFGMIPTIADRVGQWTGFGSSHGYGDGQETTQLAGGIVALTRSTREAPVMPGQKKNDQLDVAAPKGGAPGGGNIRERVANGDGSGQAKATQPETPDETPKR